MGRKLVFTNSRGGVIEFETSPYMIIKLDGLGTPGTSLQEQKAPNQDGTTFIGTLMQSRTIVLEVGIIKKAVADIDTARRDIIAKLNPKMGMGDLVLTTTGGSQYRIKCVPLSSPNIPNQDYRDPFLRVQISLYAPDPMWKEMTDESVNLPTSVNSAESVINGAATAFPSVIQLANGNLFAVYERGSDGYLVSRTYTTSWSSESVINASFNNATYPCIAQLDNGNIVVVYTRYTDSYLVSRTYNGSSWSAESQINSSPTPQGIGASVIKLANGDLFLVYQRVSDGYTISMRYTTSWGDETVVSSSSMADRRVIQLSNGNIFLVYRRLSDDYLVSRTYTSSWSTDSVIIPEYCNYPSVTQLANGSLFLAFQLSSTGELNSVIINQYAISGKQVLVADSTTSPNVFMLQNGNVFIAYLKVTSFFVSRTRSVTPVSAIVDGDVDSPIQVSFTGPSTNPRIINQDTLEYIRLNTTLTASDSFVVDTSFGKKSVTLTQGGIVKNGIAFLDIGSTFFSLTPGNNTVYFEDDSELSTATASMVYTNRYVGV